MSKVKVYDSEEKSDIVALVNCTQNLDSWDGQNNSNGGFGMHKGITRLKNGSYVIIISSQWEGASDYGFIVSDEEALQEIISADCQEFLSLKKYESLKMLMDKNFAEEEIDE